jgi:hypothetical protein
MCHSYCTGVGILNNIKEVWREQEICPLQRITLKTGSTKTPKWPS